MRITPVADLSYQKLTDIPCEELIGRGISFVMLDIDNTLSPYRNNEPTELVRQWVQELKNAGIRLYFISNNRGDRPKIFSEKLDIPYIKKAWKPFPQKTRNVLRELKIDPKQAAMVGDQSFTDVLCGNLLGCTSVLVEPIKFTNVLLAVRYYAEKPVRRLAREKH